MLFENYTVFFILSPETGFTWRPRKIVVINVETDFPKITSAWPKIT